MFLNGKLVHITLPGWVGTNHARSMSRSSDANLFLVRGLFQKFRVRQSTNLVDATPTPNTFWSTIPPPTILPPGSYDLWRGPVFAGSFLFRAAAVDAHWTAEELPAAGEWGGQAQNDESSTTTAGRLTLMCLL